jgi:hypothetical protein
MDWARVIGGAREPVEDLDRRWPREYGDVFLGLYGIEGEEVTGERGEEGLGSVADRSVGGFLFFRSMV